MMPVLQSTEYQMIVAHYGERRAERSQVLLINHINEGLMILDRIGASEYAKRAYCLHPLLQADPDLARYHMMVAKDCDPVAVLLAMEYRNTANAYLSTKVGNTDQLKLSPLPEVNDMLRADKIQNRKDFLAYHFGTHPRSQDLDQYFREWLQALDVSEQQYLDHVDAIQW